MTGKSCPRLTNQAFRLTNHRPLSVYEDKIELMKLIYATEILTQQKTPLVKEG